MNVLIAGRYRLLSPLGEGGMGTVWRARDEVLHREVAVKEVRAPAGLATSEVERLYARLEREAWAAARVANRNVVTVYDVATEDGRPWIVMELVRGISLADLLDAEGPLGPQRAAHIGAEVLAALRAAHEAGVLHRDVKPGNVLLSNDGRVVLTDFGIATVEGSSALTMTGEVIGSPEFLAPERALGRTPGPESDLWSLGVLLYAAVEGNSPFRQNTPLSTLRADRGRGAAAAAPGRAADARSSRGCCARIRPSGRRPTGPSRSCGSSAAGGHAPRRTPCPGGAVRADHRRRPSRSRRRRAPYRSAPTPTVRPRPRPAGPPGPQPPRGRRPGRGRWWSLALALGGLTYALLNQDNGDAGRADRQRTPIRRRARPAQTHRRTSPATSPSRRPEPERERPRARARRSPCTVTLVRLEHRLHGQPVRRPRRQAPAFTATFTVGRAPGDGVLPLGDEDGRVPVHGGWKTLTFPAGGGRTQAGQTVRHDRRTTERDVRQDAISVEVRDPVERDVQLGAVHH